MTGERTRPAHEGPAPVKALPGELDDSNGSSAGSRARAQLTDALRAFVEPAQ